MGAPGAVETEEQEINPPVKMRLERSAERDKREIKIIIPLKMARAQRKPFQIVPPSCIYHIFIDNKPHFAVN